MTIIKKQNFWNICYLNRYCYQNLKPQTLFLNLKTNYIMHILLLNYFIGYIEFYILKFLFPHKHIKIKLEGLAECLKWKSTCLTSMRSRVQTPVTHTQKRMNSHNNASTILFSRLTTIQLSGAPHEINSKQPQLKRTNLKAG